MTTSPARPAAQTQLTGSALEHSNCTWACATMAVDRYSMGRYRPSPDHLRAVSGDTSGGSTYNQNAEAVAEDTSIRLEPRYGLTRSQVRDYIASGRAASISIDCSVTRYTSRRTGTYTGGHSVHVERYVWRAANSTPCSCEKQTTTAHAEFDVCDPGKSTTYLGYKRWSAALLFKAAEARMGGAPGDPCIAVLLTRDTEGVTRMAVESGQLYSAASSSSTVVGSFTKGKSFSVVSTRNGGGWLAGTVSHSQWHRIKVGTSYAYAKGRALQ